MFQVTVEDSFAAGHSLRGYRGKCENVHGHNYKVRVTLEGPALDATGLLCDFKDLKEAIQSSIRKLDHQFLNEVPPFDVLNPSAENLAKYLYEEIGRLFAGPGQPAHPHPPGRVRVVQVWETDTTTASYFSNGAESPSAAG